MGQRRKDDRSRREYVVKSLEELKRELTEYANEGPEYVPAEDFSDWAAAQIFAVAWRQGDTITTLSAAIELIGSMCHEIEELQEWAKSKGFQREK